MIDTRELRLKNWLFHEATGQYVQVRGDLLYAIDVLGNGKESEYTPIRLTSDILEKCGFVYDVNIDEYGISYWDLFMSERVFSIGFLNNDFYFIDILGDMYYKTLIKSLHHLQNIFHAIVGKELTISL